MSWKTKVVDVAERAFATFAQAFLAVVVVNGGITEITALETAAVAGGFAVAKYLLVVATNYVNQQPAA